MTELHPILNTDAYSLSSDGFAPESARQYSCYNFTNRRSARVAFPDVALDSRMVLYGVRHYVETYLSKPVTLAHVREAELFMNDFHSFGGPVYFPKELWRRVATECGGYLPITIKSLHDGSTFFPYETPIQVEAKDGFGELAAHVEARLVGTVANATACATLCKHWRKRIEDEIVKDFNALGRKFTKDDVKSTAKWMIHNFGSRACVTGEESRLTGMAHLLSFNGTDNLDAAYQARCQGAKPPIGSSVLALAHRNVQSHDGENRAFRSIAATEHLRGDKFKIVSCVADCYDYNIGVERVIDLAKADSTTVYVARPDSGDGKAQLLHTCMRARDEGVCQSENGMYVANNLRFIYGDSVSPQYMFEIWEELRRNGFPLSQWGIFGVGGYIVNNSTRDTLSSSFKLAQTFSGPKVKLSNTPAKMSVPYATKMKTNVGVGDPRVYIFGSDSRDIVYNNGIQNVGWDFNRIVDLSDESFDTSKQNEPDWGLNRESLCDDIKLFQDNELKAHIKK